MSGDPDVLEYYKNEHSKKPLRIINLNFCMQLDVGLNFNKKQSQRSFVFDIITNERTFHLMAETEADMNRWVQNICQICGFSQTKGNTDTLRNSSSVNHSLRSTPAEFTSSSQHLLQTRRSSPLLHSSQPAVSSHIQPALSTSAPQEYQNLHQCLSQRTENARSATFSQSTRQESDTATQNLAQGDRHCISRDSGQVHGFYSLPKPSRQFKDHAFDLPQSRTKGSLTVSEADNENEYTFSHTKGSPTVSEADNEDVYTFKVPSNTLCREFGDLLVDSAIAPPPQHPKIPWCGNPQQRPPANDYKYPMRGIETVCWSAKSPKRTIMGKSHSGSSDDNCMPINLGSSTLLALEQTGDNSHSAYIPMNTVPHHFDPLGYPSTALPIHRVSSGEREIQPPPINRNLKPGRKAKPPRLDLRNNTVINELPFKSPVTKSWSSQYCHSISTQNMTNTGSRDREENYVPMQNPMCSSPVPSGTNNPALKKNTGNVKYITLDFHPVSLSPHHKPSPSSVTSDEKVKYVQIDKIKTQALQKTIEEWTKIRQSSRPSKDAKLW
ncbi:GRB2-associated-binding protein 2-like isoform X1 [Cricetulus griseus]|uniref:GRB2-associated-binding protein 2-like isoform X1 n=1 Tax=Cricetulus griseus TaxID=10029 RepID=UPI0015C3CD6A|nr:GRB2-associated-binding protein 2-like isoform X1 [Cricetulus griseus]